MTDPRTIEAFELVREMRPMLKGHDPAAQGAALAQLLAYFIAGHDEQIRVTIMLEHMKSVWRMVEGILKDREGH